jgi:hypothetical protein
MKKLREWLDRVLAKLMGPGVPIEKPHHLLRPDNPDNKPFHQTPGLGPTPGKEEQP